MMKKTDSKISVTTSGPDETVRFAERLAPHLCAGDIVCLYGDLGSGKTTFVKGLASGLKVPARHVHSPTFVIMNIYQGRLPLYHFDFYRLEAVPDIAALGYEEFLYGDGIAVVEWAGRLGALSPQEQMKVCFKFVDEQRRKIVIEAKGARWRDVLASLDSGRKAL